MGYQVLRFEKIKSRKALDGRCKHATRERHPENADRNKAYLNEAVRLTNATLEAFDKRLGQIPKVRKNAVLAVEILVGFSPEETKRLAVAQQDMYFREARQWATKLFGGPLNVLNWTIHRDESTSPHMTMFVMPILKATDKKTDKEIEQLNCKHWLGGAKKLSLLQDRFQSDVAGFYELQRGIRGSQAHHQEVKRFYGALQLAAAENAKFLEPVIPKHERREDPNKEIRLAIEWRDQQLKPQFAALTEKAQMVEMVQKQNKALKVTIATRDREIAAKDREIGELRKENTKLKEWIEKAKELIVLGGQRLRDFFDVIIAEHQERERKRRREELKKKEDLERRQQKEREEKELAARQQQERVRDDHGIEL